MRSPFFPQTGAHDIHIWGIFCGNSRPCARRAVRFLDSLPAVLRHFSASAAPAPRCGYKIRPPVFYTASRLIRTLPCAVAAIVRQSAGGPPSLNAPYPPQLPRQSSTAPTARTHAAAIHFIQICREPSKAPAPYPRPGPRSARRSGSASPAMLPRPGHPAPAPVAGTAPHALPTSFRSK